MSDSRLKDIASRKVEKKILVVVGPTASGKTSVSIHIAKRLNGEILSADSRQIYKLMDIGTAKPSPQELSEARHHFIDILHPDENFSAGDFGKLGVKAIDEIFSRQKLPIVTGGSGLYIRSLMDGLFDGPGADDSIRQGLKQRLKNEGPESLLAELHRVDPDAAAKMLPSNTRRIMRALEVFSITGIPISRMQAVTEERDFEPVMVGLSWDRQKLYRRINRRADMMLERGLIEEVRGLMQKKYGMQNNALQTVGYKEALEFLEGTVTFEQMAVSIKQNTRRFAKRQLTWFRRDQRIRWFEIEDEAEFSEVAENISDYFLTVCNKKF